MEVPKVFVSHSHHDSAFARRLVTDLRQAGADVWFDESEITAGDFMQRIGEALQRCEWLVLVLSPSAIASSYVQMEVNAALHRVQQRLLRAVIPVQAAPCVPATIPALWDTLHRYDATQRYADALAGLLDALGLTRSPLQDPHELLMPQAAQVRREYIVSPRGNVGYSTLREAVSNSGPGSRILLRPGEYFENVEIVGSRHIEGPGDPSAVTVGKITVLSGEYETRFANLTVKNGLTVMGRSTEIENCVIQPGGVTCIYIFAREATLRNNTISARNCSGVIVSRDSSARLEDNRITCDPRLRGDGVRIDGSAVLVRNTIENCNYAIVVRPDAECVAQDNDLRGNHYGAWSIHKKAGRVQDTGNRE